MFNCELCNEPIIKDNDGNWRHIETNPRHQAIPQTASNNIKKAFSENPESLHDLKREIINLKLKMEKAKECLLNVATNNQPITVIYEALEILDKE